MTSPSPFQLNLTADLAGLAIGIALFVLFGRALREQPVVLLGGMGLAWLCMTVADRLFRAAAASGRIDPTAPSFLAFIFVQFVTWLVMGLVVALAIALVRDFLRRNAR